MTPVGGFGFGRAPWARDAETEVALSFEDAVHGTTVTLPQGAGRSDPPAVSDGAFIRRGTRPVRLGTEARRRSLRAGEGQSRSRSRWDPRKPHGSSAAHLPGSCPRGRRCRFLRLRRAVTVKIRPAHHGKVLRVRGQERPERGPGDLLSEGRGSRSGKAHETEKELLERFAQEHAESPRAVLEEFMEEGKAKGSQVCG